MLRKLAAGNWKMNGTSTDLDEITALAQSHPAPTVDLLICPPATLLHRAVNAASGSAITIGGQDCHSATSGAHTGDSSAMQLVDAGAKAVILGHSERREDHGENSELICAKAQTAQSAGLTTVICVGESLAQREAGETLPHIGAQLATSIPKNATDATLVIAYEPIWAIGTGRIPSLEQIGEVHDFIRAQMIDRFGTDIGMGIRLLYGGSVKPDNAADIFAVSNVDGALVGGASLTAAQFSPIISALEAS